MSERTPPDPLDLNQIVSLPQEKQPVAVLQWLVDCESFLTDSSPEQISRHQETFRRAFTNILSLPIPPFGHVVRNCLGRCFSHIFAKGDRRVLFDTVATLLQKVNQLRTDKEAKQKHATMLCLGAILAVASDSVMQLIPEVVSSLVKVIRTSHLEVGLRAIAFASLRKTFIRQSHINDEGMSRDLIKIVRHGLGDKTYIIQLQAARLLEQLSRVLRFVSTLAELESLKTYLLLTMDTRSKTVRQAAALSLASLLLSVKADGMASDTLNENNIRDIKRRKGNPPISAEVYEDGRSSPVPGKSVPSTPFRIDFLELLRQLSTSYARAGSRYVRAGIMIAYTNVFKSMGISLVNSSYSTILEHILTDVATHPLVGVDRFRTLEARRHIHYLLGSVIRQQLLNEPGKVMALRAIVKSLAKNQDIKGVETDPLPVEAIVSALVEIAGFIEDLGSAISVDQESLQETLIRFIQHTNGAIQTAAAWSLRSFILAVPAQIEPIFLICKIALQRHLEQLGDNAVPHGRIALGIAQGLAVVVQICPFRPLYFSTDGVNEVWTLATSLLQVSAKSDLRISQVQIQVAWNLIGALMVAGSQFIKSRLNQLLLLWQNALPRPFSRDSMAGRTHSELQYLVHVKEKALTALYLFLHYNSKLLTNDTSKRIVTMLSDTSTFVGRLPSAPSTDDIRLLTSHSQLIEIGTKVRMRIFKCHSSLVSYDSRNTAGPELLMATIAGFVESEATSAKYIPGKSAAHGSSDCLALTGDNYAWGVSGYVGYLSIPDGIFDDRRQRRHWSVWDSNDDIVEQLLLEPIIGAIENDASQIFIHGGTTVELPTPLPSATANVDAAIDLFACMVLDQPLKIQESAFAQIASCIGDVSLTRNVGRKAAVLHNIAIALSKAFSQPMQRGFKGINQSEKMKSLILDVLLTCLVNQDPSIRFIAGDTIGRLCSFLPDSDVAKQIKSLTESVISNREPNARAGFAFALGSILYYMGGMASGLHLRTVLGLLLSLANDPHPTVHFWASEALEKAINSAGLSFSSHAASCLGAMSRLILSDIYDPEDVVSAMSNTALDSFTLASLTRCLDAIINVLGPDLASSKKSRQLICTLVTEMGHNPDMIVSTEALRCMQHINLYTPEAVDQRCLIRRLQTCLASDIPQIRQISCEAMYGLIRKDIVMVFHVASPSLPDELWMLLNTNGQAANDVGEIIRSWVEQTALTDVKNWIQMCLKLLTHSGQRDLLIGDSKANVTTSEPSEFIDEAAAFSSQSMNKGADEEGLNPFLRWQAVSFALNCLRRVVELNMKAVSAESPDPCHPLVVGVADLIRAAFTAATSIVVDVRLGGLKLLHDIIKGLAGCIDPDFPENTLLEQFQAQIGSALTPAFAADSSPEVAAEAISICAEFISSSVVKDVDHMGRLLRILVAGLVHIEEDSFVGDLKMPSTNARIMLRLAILSAWADLQIQSTHWDYLVDIVAPHINRLIPLWLGTLTDYAKLQYEPDVSDGILLEDLIADSQSSYPSKEFLTQIYEPCWLHIIDAVATLIEQESEYVFTALDLWTTSGESEQGATSRSNYRDEPVAFFFGIYGLCFQTLLKMINRDDSKAKHTISVVLDAIRKFLRPSICGNAMYKSFIFAETTDLLDRLVLLESSNIQRTVIQIAANLAKYHPEGEHGQSNGCHVNKNNSGHESAEITDGIEQLLDLVHILILALNQNAGWLSERLPRSLSDTSSALAAQAMMTLLDITELFPFMIKIDLYGGIYSVYNKLLDQQNGFADTTSVFLASYRKYCQNLNQCIEEDYSVTPKVLESIVAILQKLVSRLENISLLVKDYEACCFLGTISFTTIPELFNCNSHLFGRFCRALSFGFRSEEMSNCSVKCFRVLFASDPPIPRWWAYLAISELIASFVLAQRGDHLDLRILGPLMTTALDVIERHPPEEALPMMTVFLPLLSKHYNRQPDNLDLQHSTTAAVLKLATIRPFAFKVVLQHMEAEDRGLLETALRAALAGGDEAKAEERAKPSISLKFDFATAE